MYGQTHTIRDKSAFAAPIKVAVFKFERSKNGKRSKNGHGHFKKREK